MGIQQNIIASYLDECQQIINGAKQVVKSYIPNLTHKHIKGEYCSIENISTIRPSKDDLKKIAEDTIVSFVPMASLNTFNTEFTVNEERKLNEVKSGFTYFRDNDILLAKITPCFENGKAGIARNLKNGIGFGSTEYIVIRANTNIVYPEWIFYHINTPEFINGGKHYMTGTAGQQRIDINYVKQYQIPVPSLEEQKKLLDSINTEKKLIESSRDLIKIFERKINDKINDIWNN